MAHAPTTVAPGPALMRRLNCEAWDLASLGYRILAHDPWPAFDGAPGDEG